MRKVGLDCNSPIDEEGNPVWRVDPDFMSGTGTAYVRTNFRLVKDKWDSPADSRFLQVYDKIVDGLKGKGIKIYGLIGHEAVHDWLGDNLRNAGENPAANDWIDRYVENFVTIVEHFKDRVEIFESFNEPNNFPKGIPPAWIHPYWFAKMLERIYRAVKLERGFTDVTLVSGPLLAHDIHGEENEHSMATKYLRDTYQAGKEKHGWEEVRSFFGSYPLDGIGYHLYVRQGAGSTSTDIEDTYKNYLGIVSDVVQEQDVADKKIYVSEFGWQSTPGEEFQAKSLKAGFECLRKDPRVALAIYFCTQDFFENDKIVEWGLVRMNEDKKQAYDAFLKQARLDREEAERISEVTVSTLQEKIARLQMEAQGLRQQLAESQTTVARLQQEVQVMRQQATASQETIIQLRRQVDTLRQQLLEATTPTPFPPPAIIPPPIEDITTRLRRHPVKRFDQRILDQIKYLVIQHSVLPGDFPPEKIANFLVEKKQWPGIGYHFYITSDGKIYQTNRLETVCYFAGSNVQHNPLGVCICFAGDFTEAIPPPAQLSNGGKLLAFLMHKLHLPMESIRGHKEFVATQSPGNQWDGGRKWKDMLLAEVKAAQV